MSISLEQRNAQKLYNILNVANQNLQNRDIYFYLKYYVKTMINHLKLSNQDYEQLIGHVKAIATELINSHWDIRKFDQNKYDKFLNDFYTKVNFQKIDTDFMFKCKDLLEVSQNKNDLYRRRMAFFDKKLPKISQMTNNNVNNFNNVNVNVNNANQNPINPFADINNQNSSPYSNNIGYGNNNNPYNSPYNNINNEKKNILRGQPTSTTNNINTINNNMNNMNMNNMNNMNKVCNINNQNNSNNANNMYNLQNTRKKIPEDIKEKIIKELKIVSDEIINGKIDNCRQHSVEALLIFKQIFPEE